jgi:hypothetical protein
MPTPDYSSLSRADRGWVLLRKRRRIMSIHLKTWQWVVLTLVLLFVVWLSLVVVVK